jgi:hypothetical protein
MNDKYHETSLNNLLPVTTQTDPVIWQWQKLSPQLRSVIAEYAGCTSKAIKQLSKKDAVEIEDWLKCTLNGAMGLMGQGNVDLRFD